MNVLLIIIQVAIILFVNYLFYKLGKTNGRIKCKVSLCEKLLETANSLDEERDALKEINDGGQEAFSKMTEEEKINSIGRVHAFGAKIEILNEITDFIIKD